MCMSVFDCHLCGQFGNEIEFKRCDFKTESIKVLRTAYETGKSKTPEDEWKIEQLRMACNVVFQVWDEVSIKPDCAACTAEVVRLGEVVAIDLCVRNARVEWR
jgi:hypothetical protein